MYMHFNYRLTSKICNIYSKIFTLDEVSNIIEVSLSDFNM